MICQQSSMHVLSSKQTSRNINICSVCKSNNTQTVPSSFTQSLDSPQLGNKQSCIHILFPSPCPAKTGWMEQCFCNCYTLLLCRQTDAGIYWVVLFAMFPLVLLLSIYWHWLHSCCCDDSLDLEYKIKQTYLVPLQHSARKYFL